MAIVEGSTEEKAGVIEPLGLNEMLSPKEEEKESLEDKLADSISGTKEDYQKLSQQYSSLQGILKSNNEEIKAMKEKAEALAIRNEELAKTNEALQQKPATDYLSPDEAQSIQHTRPIMDKMLAQTADQVLEQANQQIQQSSLSSEERLKKIQEDNYRSLVRMAHPDIDAVMASEEFEQYRIEKNALANRSNGELLQGAINEFDAEHSINWFRELKNAYPEKFGKKEVHVEPPPAGADVNSNAESGPLIKESAYKEAFDKRFKKKTMSQEDWLKFKAVYDPALAEGRVIQD